MPRKRETRRLSSNLGTAALFREIKTQADFQKRRSKRGEGVRPASKGLEALGWRPMQQLEVGLRDGVEVRNEISSAHTPAYTRSIAWYSGRCDQDILAILLYFILHCASSDDSAIDRHRLAAGSSTAQFSSNLVWRERHAASGLEVLERTKSLWRSGRHPNP